MDPLGPTNDEGIPLLIKSSKLTQLLTHRLIGHTFRVIWNWRAPHVRLPTSLYIRIKSIGGTVVTDRLTLFGKKVTKIEHSRYIVIDVTPSIKDSRRTFNPFDFWVTNQKYFNVFDNRRPLQWVFDNSGHVFTRLEPFLIAVQNNVIKYEMSWHFSSFMTTCALIKVY